MEKLGQYYKLAKVIGCGLIGSLLVFAAVIETLKSIPTESQGLLSPSLIEMLRYLLLGVSVIEFFVIRFIRKMILSSAPRADLSRGGDLTAIRVQKLFVASIISMAFCEAVAIYGLVLFIVGRDSFDFYLFTFLSLIFFYVYFPRYPQWEAWVNSRDPGQSVQGSLP